MRMERMERLKMSLLMISSELSLDQTSLPRRNDLVVTFSSVLAKSLFKTNAANRRKS